MEGPVLGKAPPVSILTSAKDTSAMKLIWISLLFAMVALAGCAQERPVEAPSAQEPQEPPAAYEPPAEGPVPSAATCTDSDGDDKFIQGKVTIGEEEYVDYCMGANSLKEYICVSETEKGEKGYDCDCEDGACLPGVTHVECVDTDGGQDRYAYGEVYLLTYYTDGSTEKGEVFADYCIEGTNNMREFYCEGGEIRKLSVGCVGCDGGVCPQR